jgi:type I restriction enzyme S subunit
VTRYPTEALAEALVHRSEFVTIDDEIAYKRCRVQLRGNGVVPRDIVRGGDLKTKRQQLCRPNDFLVAEIDAKLGGFGVVPEELDGAIVSSHYFLFDINEHKLLPSFLDLYVRTPSFQEQVVARGSTNYAAIRPAQVLTYKVPLPSLPEQEHLVAFLHSAEARITEAQRLQDEATAEAGALLTSAVGERLSARATGTVGAVLLEKPRNGWSPRCDNAEGGAAVLGLGAITGFKYRPLEYKRTSEVTTDGRHYWLEPGDLLMTRSNTEHLVGHAAIYSGEPTPCIYPDLMMRLKVNPQRVDTRFLYYWLRTPNVRARIQDAASGTSGTMKKITQKHVMDLPFPVELTLEEQRAAVRSLDEIVSRVEELRSHQLSATDDLRALMPSLLDRAFRGDLVVQQGARAL